MGDWTDMTFEQWLELGQGRGFCTKPVCATHEGIPNIGDEEAQWEDGGDPCQPAVRLLP